MGFICYRKIEKKAQSISAQNKNPHILSRGGYRKLEEKIMLEKKKSRPPPSEGEDIEPPSPPSRHQKWKLARLRTSSNYTSKSAREIYEKIVRYNSYLNSSFMFYIVLFFINFFFYIARFIG